MCGALYYCMHVYANVMGLLVTQHGVSAHLLAHNLHPPTVIGTSRTATTTTLSTGTNTATRRTLSSSDTGLSEERLKIE